MKIFLAVFLSAIGTVSAQQWGNNWGSSKSVAVNGILQLKDGTIAVASGKDIYYVPALERYVGFVEGLKEGAKISLEGYITGNGNYVHPAKATINGKNYDLGRTNARHGGCCGGCGWY